MASLISFLVDPWYAHRVSRRGYRAITAAVDADKILPFVCLAVMRLAFVQRVTERMRTMSVA